MELIRERRRLITGDNMLAAIFALAFAGVLIMVSLQVGKLTARQAVEDKVTALTIDRDYYEQAYLTLREATSMEVTASGKVAYYADGDGL